MIYRRTVRIHNQEFTIEGPIESADAVDARLEQFIWPIVAMRFWNRFESWEKSLKPEGVFEWAYRNVPGFKDFYQAFPESANRLVRIAQKALKEEGENCDVQ